MKTALKIASGVVLALAVVAAGVMIWAGSRTADLLERTIETHRVDFPVPFPLDSAEIADLGLTPAMAEEVALEVAVDRGRHLVAARYGCNDCHGQDFGGGVMVDDPGLGRLLGPNITTGQGSRSVGYTPSDWDRLVRHGVRPDGTPAAMPAEDFRRMSDQELSDIVAYIRSLPPVNETVPPVRLGPLGRFLVAIGQLPLAADVVGDHYADHPRSPPEAEVTVAFGRHLAGPCVGCHTQSLAGGPIKGGDPSWPPAANLTPGADGIGAWSYDDFVTAMREGRRPDGTALAEPMSQVLPYARNMTETELGALWAFLRSIAARPSS